MIIACNASADVEFLPCVVRKKSMDFALKDLE